MMNNINNLPEYAYNYKYIVAREIDDELWFFGAWDDKERAEEVALEERCVIIENKERA